MLFNHMFFIDFIKWFRPSNYDRLAPHITIERPSSYKKAPLTLR